MLDCESGQTWVYASHSDEVAPEFARLAIKDDENGVWCYDVCALFRFFRARYVTKKTPIFIDPRTRGVFQAAHLRLILSKIDLCYSRGLLSI